MHFYQKTCQERRLFLDLYKNFISLEWWPRSRVQKNEYLHVI